MANNQNVSAGVQFAALLEAAQRAEPGVRMCPQPGGGFVARQPDSVKVVEDELPGQMKQERGDEVKNNAGGYVFTVSDETRVRRFLIMGTSGGTFYVSEKELTMQNMQALVEIIEKGNGAMILCEIEEISLAGRNPKQDPVMFALALCARYRVSDTKHQLSKRDSPEISRAYALYLKDLHHAAFLLVPKICRIPTHLFSFVKYCEIVSKETCGQGKSTGWGRQMRECIVKWYAGKNPDQLAMAVTKYGKREGWSHRDLFRLAHPKVPVANDAENFLEVTQIYKYIVKGTLETRKRRLHPAEAAEEMPETKYSKQQMDREETSSALNLIETFKSLTKDTPEEEVVKAIKEKGLVREHIPTEHLNSVAVWEALLEKMPMIALIRNLAKMQAIEVIKGQRINEIIEKIVDEKAIASSKIHPVQILMAHYIYEKGSGDKGKLKWNPLPQIVKALEKAFYMSFKNVEPTGKRLCYAFDISGSMDSPVLGSTITCRLASVAMGMVGLRTEEHVDVVAFCEDLVEIPFTKEWNLTETCDYFDNLNMGATDCAQPMLWATKEKKEIDVFVVFTDNETWFGEVHPYKALQQYRESSGIKDAKLIVVGMSATEFSIADPDDVNMLDVAGFDAAVPQVMSDFIMGRI